MLSTAWVYRVLLVDCDPHSNLSMSFGIERPDELTIYMHNILSLITDGETLPDKSEYIMRSKNLDIIPYNINLAATEINLHDEEWRKTLSDFL